MQTALVGLRVIRASNKAPPYRVNVDTARLGVGNGEVPTTLFVFDLSQVTPVITARHLGGVVLVNAVTTGSGLGVDEIIAAADLGARKGISLRTTATINGVVVGFGAAAGGAAG